MNNLYALPKNINYTPEQKDAIFKEGTNILVSAAAGCGKTTLMVERIIRKVLQDHIDINTLVVVTFTDAAANELKERLEKALNERLLQMPEHKTFIERQIALLNEAYITTFHALCFRLLNEHNLNFQFDNDIHISTGLALDTAKLKAYHQFYQEHCLEDDFIVLDEYYNASLTNKDKLFKILTSVIDIAHNNGGFKPFKDVLAKPVLAVDDIPVFNQLLKEYLTYYTQSIINDFKTICLMENTPKAKAHAEQHITLFEELQTLINDFDITKITSHLKSLEFVRNNKNYVLDETKKIYTDLRKTANDKLIKVFNHDADTIIKIYQTMRKHNQLLVKYAEMFNNSFEQIKKHYGLLEYNDLESYALALLYNEDDSYTQTALDLQKYFREIMIDEYQDTSKIQEKIVNALSSNNQFMVGDVKQSIYRFRNATSEIFTKKYLAYLQSDQGSIINLSTNFRSRPEVLNFINFVFKNIFSQNIGGLNYDDETALHFGNTKLLEDQGNFKTELLVNIKETKEPKGSKDIISDSKMVVSKVQELINNGANYRDIAILYRASTNINYLEQALMGAKIPYMNHGGSGFYKIAQIKDLINFLNVLVNPQDEVALLSILKSAFFNLNDEDLLALQLNDSSLILSLKGLYPSIYETISSLRQASTKLNIIELIDKIYEMTDYQAYMQSQINYPNFIINLNAFKSIITDNYAYFNSLAYFVMSLNKNIKSDFDQATPAIISSKQNVVNMMTIHKAKGLEFKYVFVLCDTKINIKRNDVEHLANQLVIDYFNENNRTKATSYLFRSLYNFNELTPNIAEELRILYVALTRAQLKLFLVFNTTEEKLAILSSKVADERQWQLNPYLILQAKSYSELLLLALLRHQDHKGLITGYQNNASEAIMTYQDDLYQVTKFSESNEKTNETIDAVYDHKTILQKVEPFNVGKTASTKLKPSSHYNKQLLDFNALKEQDTYQQGNNTHKVLELLDFKSATLSEDIANLSEQYDLIAENKDGIMHLAQDAFFNQLINKQYYQEYNFTTYVDNQLTSGVIDLLVEDDNRLYVIDYKSDRLDSEELKTQYANQLKTYEKALAHYSDKAVKLYLYSIKNKEFINI